MRGYFALSYLSLVPSLDQTYSVTPRTASFNYNLSSTTFYSGYSAVNFEYLKQPNFSTGVGFQRKGGELMITLTTPSELLGIEIGANNQLSGGWSNSHLTNYTTFHLIDVSNTEISQHKFNFGSLTNNYVIIPLPASGKISKIAMRGYFSLSYLSLLGVNH